MRVCWKCYSYVKPCSDFRDLQPVPTGLLVCWQDATTIKDKVTSRAWTLCLTMSAELEMSAQTYIKWLIALHDDIYVEELTPLALHLLAFILDQSSADLKHYVEVLCK